MSEANGVEALARMLPALLLIIGALLLVRRWAQRGGRFTAGPGVRVVSRTGLTRGAMLAVVEVSGRRYLLGAGEQGVRLLTELEPGEDDVPAEDAGATDAPLHSTADRPWMGLVNRLQQMTVRSSTRPPSVPPR